nr:PqiC family protein [uncultured Rhodopila sp.]
MRRLFLSGAAALLLASCAGPPLTVYTLNVPVSAVDTGPLGTRAVVIQIVRVAVPDELDSQDIVYRNGDILHRSQVGRWASRLSLGVTDRLTERLAARRPDALVTDQPRADAATYRVLINISRLDVTASGTAVLEADWTIVPRDAAKPVLRDRVRLTASGPVATDQDVVTLVGGLLDRLAAAIDLAGLR